MKCHQREVNKTLNQLEIIIFVFIFILSGIVSALIINSGHPIGGFLDLFEFLGLALLVGIFSSILPICIFYFMYNALGIRNIYNLGYSDAIFDQKDKEKRAIKQGFENYKLAYATHNIDPDKFPLVKSLPPERIMKFIDDIGEKYPEKHVDDILIILEKELRNKKYE